MLQREPWSWEEATNYAELKTMILEHLDNEDLKAIRLVCRSMRDEGASMLFRHVYLNPSMTSVRRLQQLARRPQLARLVKVLECDNLIVGDLDTDRATHKRSIKRVLRSDDSPWSKSPYMTASSYERRILARLYSAYLDEMAAEQEFENLLRSGDLQLILGGILGAFKQLNSVIWLENKHFFPMDDEAEAATIIPNSHPVFIRTGASRMYQTYMFRFLELCEGLPPRLDRLTLYMTGFGLDSFGDEAVNSLSWCPSLVSSLRILHLTIDTQSICVQEVSSSCKLFQVLDEAKEVQDLHLGLTDKCMRDYNEEEYCDKFWLAMLDCTFPNLRRLRLEHVCTRNDRLLEFLGRHRPKLACLTVTYPFLSWIATDQDVFPGCATRFLLSLRRLRLKLETFRIQLDDEFEDDWWCAITNSIPNLERRIVTYICRSGPFPFAGLEHLSEEQVALAVADPNPDRHPFEG